MKRKGLLKKRIRIIISLCLMLSFAAQSTILYAAEMQSGLLSEEIVSEIPAETTEKLPEDVLLPEETVPEAVLPEDIVSEEAAVEKAAADIASAAGSFSEETDTQETALSGTIRNADICTKTEPVPLRSVKLKHKTMTYTGKKRTQSDKMTVKAKVNGKIVILTYGKDFTVQYKNNVNVGTAEAIVTGKGSYTGTITKTFRIRPAAITDVRLRQLTCGYTGELKTPDVVVSAKRNNKEIVLKKGRDYNVTYKNNRKKGRASITVKGKGNYTGTITRYFTIHQIDYIQWAKSVADDDDYIYGHNLPSQYDIGSFSCSTLVGAALYLCGYIGSMPPANHGWLGGLNKNGKCLEGELLRNGFKFYSTSELGAVSSMAQDNLHLLKPGDIMWRYGTAYGMHVGIYMGDGLFVEARGGDGPNAIGCFPDFNYFQGIFRLSDEKLR